MISKFIHKLAKYATKASSNEHQTIQCSSHQQEIFDQEDILEAPLAGRPDLAKH